MRGANTPAYRGMGTPRVRRVFARRDDELGAGCVVVAEVARRYEQRVVNSKAYVDVHVRRGDSGSCRFRTPPTARHASSHARNFVMRSGSAGAVAYSMRECT